MITSASTFQPAVQIPLIVLACSEQYYPLPVYGDSCTFTSTRDMHFSWKICSFGSYNKFLSDDGMSPVNEVYTNSQNERFLSL